MISAYLTLWHQSLFFLKENHFTLNSKQNSIYNIINKYSISFFTVSPKNKAPDLIRIYI